LAQPLRCPCPTLALFEGSSRHSRAMNTNHSHQVARSAAVVGLSGVALIHLLELQGKLEETPYLGIGYILLIIASVIAGALLVHGNSRIGWMMSGGAALATLVGYSLTRTVGLPQSSGDIGNWLEPMGLASLFVEGIVVALSGYALATFKGVTATSAATGSVASSSTVASRAMASAGR
jgi:hypothetical protein